MILREIAGENILVPGADSVVYLHPDFRSVLRFLDLVDSVFVHLGSAVGHCNAFAEKNCGKIFAETLGEITFNTVV